MSEVHGSPEESWKGCDRFVELGRYLCEVRAGQYWRLEKLKSL